MTGASPSVTFLSSAQLQGHLEECHTDEVKGPMLATSIKYGMIQNEQPFQDCPFCAGYPEEIEKKHQTRDCDAAYKALEKHVRNHLISMALILAPEETEESGDEAVELDSEAQPDNNNKRDDEGIGDVFDLECQNPNCDCKHVSEYAAAYPPLVPSEPEWEIESLRPDKVRETTNRSITASVGDDEGSIPSDDNPDTYAKSELTAPAFDISVEMPEGDVLNAEFIEDMLVPEVTEFPLNPAYLNLEKLFAYSSEHIVRATLLQTGLPGSHLSHITRYATAKARRTFVLLVYMGMLEHIGDLQGAGFEDRNLPLFLRKNGRQQVMYDAANNHWTCFDRWTSPQKHYFFIVQWSFMAQPLHINKFETRFYERQPLHFRTVDGLGGKGGFYSVRKTEVPIETTVSQRVLHLKPSTDASFQTTTSYRIVAVKYLTPDSGEEYANFYNKEKDTLVIMRQLNHRHLIRANAAFERGSTRGFIFPWADGGSLADIWRREDTSLNDAGLLSWALSQIEGLTDGIAALATSHIRHGDLKPANILCFPTSANDNRGILKVAGAGLAKYHREYTAERIIVTTTKFTSRRYMPPEATLEGVVCSRKYDIWSLGCVLLEFLIWLSLGRRRLLDFVAAATVNKEEIPFWEGRPPELSKLATDWIEEVSNVLARAPQHARALVDILDLIRTRLLRIAVGDRAYAQEALKHIQEARRKYHAPTKAKADPSDLSSASDRSIVTAQAGSTGEQQRGTLSPTNYFLSPRFDISASDDMVVLGRIIVDPQNPESGIPGYGIVTVPQSAIYKSEVSGWQWSMEQAHSGTFGRWAKFKEVLSVASSGKPKSSSDTKMVSASTLETIYILPDDYYIAQAIETPAFQKYLEAHEWRRPAYMITGIKIAKGATIGEDDHTRTSQLDDANIGNTAGPEVAVSQHKTSPTLGDILFAYSLTRIMPKGQKSLKARASETTEQPDIGEGAARFGINVRDVYDIKSWTKGAAQMM